MSIYTRSGDKGYTGLVGGTRVKKYDLRVETYGTVDELCSGIGFTISLLSDDDPLKSELTIIQQIVFDCASDLAVPRENRPYKVVAEKSSFLEEKIDEYWQQLPEINQFILPGGTTLASSLQLNRTVTRRCERLAVKLGDKEGYVNKAVLIFLNRLSDYFFAAARWVNYQSSEQEILHHNSRNVFSRKSRKRKNDVSNHAKT